MIRAPLAAASVIAVLTLMPMQAAAEPVTVPHEGLTLNGDLRLAEGKALEDGVVVLVHGTLMHHGMEIIAGQQDRLAEHGLSTLAITLSLGQDNRTGMYDCATPHTHRHEDAVDEVATWVDWLNGQGAGPLTVMGHSRGGNQVARFATEHPGAAGVDRWVLVAPATWTEGRQAPEYAERFKTDLAPLVAEAQAKVDAGEGDAMMDVPGFLYCENAQASAAALASYYAEDPRFDTPSLLEDMPKPVLLVIGEGDEVIPDLPERVAEGVPDGVQVETVPDAGHMFRDFAADDLADVVADFVSQGS